MTPHPAACSCLECIFGRNGLRCQKDVTCFRHDKHAGECVGPMGLVRRYVKRYRERKAQRQARST